MTETYSIIFGVLIALNFVLLYRSTKKIRQWLAITTAFVALFFFINNFMTTKVLTDGIIKFSFIWYVISVWNFLSVLFDSKIKRRLKFDENELYKYHIESVEDFLDSDKKIYGKEKKHEHLEECDIVEINQKNLSAYIRMRNKDWRFLPLVYKNSYESFALNFLKPLYNMSRRSESIPERIAFNLRSALDEYYDVQLNVSHFSFEDFYDTNKNAKPSNSANKSERIMVFSENLKDVFENKNIHLNGTNVSLIEWIVNWHKQNQELLWVLNFDRAQEILQEEKKADLSYPIHSFDFSINYKLAKPSEVLTIINNLNLKEQRDLGIINEVDCYQLSLTKDPKYKSFYDKLKVNSEELNENTISLLCN